VDRSAVADDPYLRRWRALSVPLAAGFVSVLDSGIVSVAVPSIQRGLGASAADVQWVVSGYALMFGMALIPAGRVGDALGLLPGRRSHAKSCLDAMLGACQLHGQWPS
jgi:MFS family permease